MQDQLQCEVCGMWFNENQNTSGIKGFDGGVAVLCGLHHETSKIVAKDGEVNWHAMSYATILLNAERPSIRTEPEKWADWDPLGRLVELYEECAADPQWQQLDQERRRRLSA